MHTQLSDRDIKTSLEEMDERINKRLDTVEDSIEQIQTNNESTEVQNPRRNSYMDVCITPCTVDISQLYL